MTLVQFISVQDGISMHSEKPIIVCALARLSEVAFETVPIFVWLTMALSRPFKEDQEWLQAHKCPRSTSHFSSFNYCFKCRFVAW